MQNQSGPNEDVDYLFFKSSTTIMDDWIGQYRAKREKWLVFSNPIQHHLKNKHLKELVSARLQAPHNGQSDLSALL